MLFHIWYIQTHSSNMDNTLALLFPLLFIFSVGTAAPLPMDVVNMKSTVKRISETLVNSLNQHLQVTFIVLFAMEINSWMSYFD